MTGRQVPPGAGNGDAPVPGAPAVSWIDAVGPGWLTDVLRAAGAAEAAVRHVEARPLAVASAAGDLARLSLAFESAVRLAATPLGPASGTRKITSVAARHGKLVGRAAAAAMRTARR